jgi:hypothetical protein
MVDDELEVVTFLGVIIIGKGIIVVALLKLLLNHGIWVTVRVITFVVVAKDFIVRLEEEEEGLGDLTIALNGDAKPFITLLKERKEK